MPHNLFGDDERGDGREARKARDKALAGVLKKKWLKDAVLVFERVVPFDKELLGEDIRYLMRRHIRQPHHYNVWGAFIHKLIALGHLKPTDATAQCRAVKSHARRNPLYLRKLP